MRRIVCVLMALAVAAAVPAYAADPELKTDDEKTIYALGHLMGTRLAVFNLTPAEIEIFKAGLTDQLTHKPPKIDTDAQQMKINTLAQTRSAAGAAALKKAGKEFLDKTAAKPGVKKLDSGMLMETVTEGKGATPKATDRVKVNYTGTLLDGTIFDSSVKSGKPAEFGLNQVIKCWADGLQQMKVGGKAKFYCPSETAYGDRGSPPLILPGATLAFEVELLDILPPQAAPSMPPGHP